MMEAGIKGHSETVVTADKLAASVGSGLARVFATPMMVALVEQAAFTSVEPFLEEGQGTVGTLVNVSHLAATPEGMKVWADTELVEVDGRRLVFKVSVYDECGLVGEGTHERFIIWSRKFQEKADAKAAK